jgi:hypothetical protein
MDHGPAAMMACPSSHFLLGLMSALSANLKVLRTRTDTNCQLNFGPDADADGRCGRSWGIGCDHDLCNSIAGVCSVASFARRKGEVLFGYGMPGDVIQWYGPDGSRVWADRPSGLSAGPHQTAAAARTSDY